MRYVLGFAILAFLFACNALATTTPNTLTYQGRIVNSGTPLTESNVDFMIEIRSPDTGNCLLYSETISSVDMSSSNGMFSLTLGVSGNRTDGQAHTFIDAFDNSFDFPATLTCPGTGGNDYTPSANDGRKLILTFNDNAGSGNVTLSPAHNINAVPFAMIAQKAQNIGSIPAANVAALRDDVTHDLNQSNLEGIFTTANYTELLALLAGTSSSFMQTSPGSDVSFNSNKITDLADPTNAQDAATKNYTDANIGGTTANITGVSGGAGDGKVLSWNQAAARWEAVDPSFDGTAITSGTINKDRLPTTMNAITMSGDLDMNGNNIVNTGHITMNADMYLHLGRYDDTAEAGLVGTPLTAAHEGVMWYDEEDDTIEYWDGSAVQVVGSGSGSTLNDAYDAGAATVTVDGTGGGDVVWNLTNTEDFKIQDNGTDAFVVDDSGNVGVGVTSPVSKLHVGGNAYFGSSTNRVALAAGISAGEKGVYLRYVDTTTDYAELQAEHQGTAYQNLALNPNGGNVGIGTTTPDSQLEILGSGQTTADLTDAGARRGTLSLLGVGTAAGTGGALLFGNSQSDAAGSVGMAAIKGVLTNGSGNTVGDLAFSTRNAAADTALTERLRITSTGNIGIGTKTPTANLDIDGGDNAHIALRGDNTTNSAQIDMYDSGSNKYWHIVRRGTDHATEADQLQITYTPNGTDFHNYVKFLPNDAADVSPGDVSFSGNVGIGTATPGSKLHISQGEFTLDGVGAYFDYKPNNVKCANNEVMKWIDANDRWECGTDDNSGGTPTSRDLTAGAGLTGGGDLTADRTFDVGAGTGIVVNANDVAVDVGTTANKIVQLDGSAELPAVDGSNLTGITANQVGALANIVEDTTPQLGGTLDMNGQNISTANGFNIDITGSASGDDLTVDTDKLVVEGDTGNVGIGTATPGRRLHIQQENSSTPSLRISDVNTFVDFSAFDAGTGNESFLDISPNPGTGTDGSNIRLFRNTNTTGGVGLSVLKGDNTTTANAYIAGNGNTYFAANNGSVGIGTTSPDASALLDVSSTTKGFLPPRMTTAQRTAVSSPAEGLVVFDTDEDDLYIYKNAAWAKLADTTEVAFRVRKTSDQTITTGVEELVNWQSEDFDVGGSFTLGTDRFQPSVAGYYFVHASTDISDVDDGEYEQIKLRKNGTAISQSQLVSAHNTKDQVPQISSLVYLNGSSDYLEIHVQHSSGTNESLSSGTRTHFEGFLISGGTGGGGGGADHLGNHVATQNLIVGTNFISQTGTASKGLSFDASDNASFSNNLTLGDAAELRINDDAGGEYISFKSPTGLAGNVNYTLPPDDGNANEVLQTDGAGVLTWVAQSGGTPTSRDLAAGTGLTGGGDLTADRTFNVIGGDGIVANADDIAVDFTADKGLHFVSNKLEVEAGSGIALDANGVNVDVNGLTAETTPDGANDTVMIYDASNTALRKMTINNLTSLVGGINNVVEDTTPQLGGNLDVNGNNFTSAAGMDFSIGSSAGNDFTVDTNKLVVEGDTGNVGVGTADPGEKLEVGDSGNLLLKASAADPGDIIFQESNGNQKGRIFTSASATVEKLFFTSGDNNADLTIDASGNVGIGTTSPDASALLDVSSTTKGFLPPRMTTAQRTGVSSPAEGLVVFDTDEKNLYIYQNSAWAKMADTTEVAFRVHRNGSNITNNSVALVNWIAEDLDTGNFFDLAADRFQPTVAGYYYFSFDGRGNGCSNGQNAVIQIHKNGVNVSSKTGEGNSATNVNIPLSTSIILQMNGTTDYVEAHAGDDGCGSISGTDQHTNFEGFLISGGTGGGGGGADHLGNHIATQNIILGSHYLSGDGGDEGLQIGLGGDATFSHNLTLGDAAELRINDDAGGEYISFKSPTGLAGNVNYTLPPDDGNANDVLQTDGSGVLTWVAPTDNNTTYSADGDGIEESSTVFSIELNGTTLQKGSTGLSVNVGTSNGQIIQADATGLPAIDGSQLTNLDGSDVVTTATGNIAATNADAAIAELEAEKLALAGGTMSGAIAMGTNKITGMGDPTVAQDAATKNYVDGQVSGISSTYVAVAGDAMTGPLTMNATNEVRFADTDSSNYVGFKAPGTISTDRIWTLPAADGSSGQVLSTNGSGVLSWVAAGGTGDFKADGSVAMTGNLQLSTNSISNDGGAGEGLSFDTSGNATFGQNLTVTGTTTLTDATTSNEHVTLANQKELRLSEPTGAGSEYVSFKAPATLAANVNYTLPPDDGNANEVLQTDGAGVLTWVAQSGTPTSRDLTAGTGLTGGGDLSADRTFNVVGGDGIVANADDIAVDFTADKGLHFVSNKLEVEAGSGIALDANGVNVDVNGLTAETTPDGANDTVMIYDASNTALRKMTINNLTSLVGGISNVVEDTTPQLGGTLDMNGQNISTANGFNIDITGSASGDDFTVDTDKLVVEGDTGYVGIGATGPTYPLDVVGTAGTGWGKGVAKFESGDTDTQIFINNTATGGSNWSIASTATASGLGGGKFVIIDQSVPTNRLTIDSSGNVGIGSTSPAAKLDVAGEVKFGNTSSTCNGTNEGQQRYNSTDKVMEFCDGLGWSLVGGAIRGSAQNSLNLNVISNATNPNRRIDISADELLLKNANGGLKLVKNVSVTVNMTSSGVNGLDTGSEAADKWYYVWVISDGTTTASLLSQSSTNPTMPSGYIYKALVSVVRNDSSSHFRAYHQMGGKIIYDLAVTEVSGGSSTSGGNVNTASSTPPITTEVLFRIRAEGDGTANNLGTGDNCKISVSTAHVIQLQANADQDSSGVKQSTNDAVGWVTLPSPGSNIDYWVSDSHVDCTVRVHGFAIP